ncbi:MAG: CvpA family protein [Ignavibacteriae bacterium]|nr:CvpA family protein [Ignavibacteriota bacterium]
MNTLDVIILVIVLFLAYLGYRRGFLVSVFSLISIIIGIVLATKFHAGFALILNKFIKDARILNLVSFIIIFLLIYLAGIFLAGKLSKISKLTKSFDKILGIILGAIKGLLVASLIIIFLKSFGFMGDNVFRSSSLYPYVYRFAPDTFDTVSKVLPFNRKSFDDLNSFLKLDSLYVK